MRTVTFQFDVVRRRKYDFWDEGVYVVRGREVTVEVTDEQDANKAYFLGNDLENEFPYEQGYLIVNLVELGDREPEREAFNALLGDIEIDL